MIKTVLLGAGGRMGKTLIRCLCENRVPDLELAGAVDLWDCPDRGRDAGLMAGVGECGIPLGSDLAAAVSGGQVVIDFSGHKATAGNAPRCAEWGVPMVIGTTGLSSEEQAAVQSAADRIPIVWAPNMSLGINLLLSLVEQCASALAARGYDMEIIERHHRRKKDAPSGTALALGEAAARGAGWDLAETSVHGRHGDSTGERPVKEIGFHAVRAGDFVGDHTVLFSAEGETVELMHRATSRDTFALGALRAAAWVAGGRKPGLYGMRDVLGLDG